MEKYILWFDEVGIKDISSVGGKTSSLGEMIRNLSPKGLKVPEGFAITASAYRDFLNYSGIDKQMEHILQGLDTQNIDDLQKRGRRIRNLIRDADFPEDMKNEIAEAYARMCKIYGEDVDVAVRSSATAEDLPDASFAGQQDTYLNVRGEEALLYDVKRCFSSLFTNRAISYREDKGFDHLSTYLSVAVQKMVRSDAACSGVMFTLDPESGFRGLSILMSGTSSSHCSEGGHRS